MKSKSRIIERAEGVSGLEMATRLSFNLYPSSDISGRDLETAFIQYRCSQGLAIDRLLGIGHTLVHLCVTVALLRSANPRLAIISFVTAIQQMISVVLATRRPKTYAHWRFVFYAFNIIWSMVEGTILTQHLEISPCMSAGTGIFWLNEMISTSVPWLILHALVFPLPMPVAIIVNGGAGIAAMTTNIVRCRKTINGCAAGSKSLQQIYQFLQRHFGIFSARLQLPASGARAAAMPASALSSLQASPLTSCVTLYALVQIFAFVLTMHALWLSEHAARMEFLSRTDAVEVEWRLEQLRKPPRAEQIARIMELAATMALAAYILTAAIPEIMNFLQL